MNKTLTLKHVCEWIDEKITVYVSDEVKDTFCMEFEMLYEKKTELKESLVVFSKPGSLSYHGYIGHMQYGGTIHDAMFQNSIARVDDVVLLNYAALQKYDMDRKYEYGLVVQDGKKRYLIDLLDQDGLMKWQKKCQKERYPAFLHTSFVNMNTLFRNTQGQVITDDHR